MALADVVDGVVNGGGTGAGARIGDGTRVGDTQ